MGETLGLLCALLFVTIGAALLNDAGTGSSMRETARILFGATLVSIGLLSLASGFKSWMKWKNEYKEYRGE
jgi:uncharacterized membrane protein YidH (DUF202 family)